MFKKDLVCYVREMEALDFCNYLGRKGYEFTVRKCHRDMTDFDGIRVQWQVFRVRVPVHKYKAFKKELEAESII